MTLLEELPQWLRTIVGVAVILSIAFLLNWTVRRAIRRFVGRRNGGELLNPSDDGSRRRTQTIVTALKTAATIAIWGIALLVALSNIGFDIGPIVAGAGVVGVAIGIGGQHLTKDIIAGFFILLEDQYRVGDDIAAAGVEGRVQEMTLRSTKVRAGDGSLHTIANGDIRVATNFTKGFSRAVIDLPVPFGQDADEVAERVRDVTEEMRGEQRFAKAILGPLQVLGVEDIGESDVKLKMHVETTPGRQWDIGRELRRRIKRFYDDEGIAGGEGT